MNLSNVGLHSWVGIIVQAKMKVQNKHVSGCIIGHRIGLKRTRIQDVLNNITEMHIQKDGTSKQVSHPVQVFNMDTKV